MLSGKKLLLLGFVVVLLVVIPLTVYLVQQQQKVGVGAAPSTVLSFIPSAKSVTPGEAFTLDVNMAPGGNEVSFIKLTINYDSTKLEPNALGTGCSVNPSYVICPNPSLFPGTPLQGPTTSTNSISVTLSVGSNPASAIKTATRIATVGFKAKDSAGTTTVSYGSDSQVLSIANADQFNENVLLNSQPATVTIAGAATSPTPTASASATPSSGATGSTNSVPVCSALNLDRSSSGTAPYSITFTGQGTDSNGTITKATFNFGDGGITDVTTGGGIGTNNVNVPISHTYNNPGTFTAKVNFTDNQSGVSADTSSCTKQITVSAAAGGTGTTQVVTVTASASATPEATPTPTPIAEETTKGGLPVVGPGDGILTLGGLGAVSLIIGILILLAL